MYSRVGQKQANYETYGEEQVRRVLVASGLDVASEVDSDYIIFCPFHANNRTPAGEVSKTTGQFYCFGCQVSKTLPELVMRSTGRSYFESMRLIDSKGIKMSVEDEIESILDKKPDFVEFDGKLINDLYLNTLSSERAATYLKSRKITRESVERFKIGYSSVQDMITIPVHSPEGVCVGFVGRSVEGKVFKNSPKLPRSKTLFNLFRVRRSDRVFVVESSFDAIRLDQAGVPAVATLGASVNARQKDLLKKYFRSIILVSDNDEAGQVMKAKMRDYFGTTLMTPSLPSYVKDVSDLDDNDLKEFVHTLDNEIHYLLQ